MNEPIWGSRLSGYFHSTGHLTRLIEGVIQDFINRHGGILSKENKQSLVRRLVANIKGVVLKQPNSKEILMHEILGNADNPSSERLKETKINIMEKGLVAHKPDEWKHLLPLDIQDVPIVWMRGTSRTAIVNTHFLNRDKLRRLNIEGVDWWVYADNIPSEAITLTD